ncbi:MAG: hypothetical protein V1897_04060 [Pseudomonadota bacterium]
MAKILTEIILEHCQNDSLSDIGELGKAFVKFIREGFGGVSVSFIDQTKHRRFI